ncbi:MAG TPA: hypothetical protein VHL57_11495 [Flavobacteriales bacterium]|nr:hypothetical protein [Flavobacteriales bacterium]
MRAFASALLVLLSVLLRAQGIDSVFTEIYSVQPDPVSGKTLVTYRIFVDLAPGYELQMVYGDARNQLDIATTTDFFNDEKNGARFAHQVRTTQLNTFPCAIDSWLTMNAASDGHVGLPRAWDDDGSVLECPPYAGYGLMPVDVKPLCAADGLLQRDSVPDVVNFRMDPGYLGDVRGSELHTMDGAWAVLGGVKGVTDRNVCLIAQLTTTGELSYHLNLQLRTPDRKVVRYVSTEARGTDEVLFPGLVRKSASH